MNERTNLSEAEINILEKSKLDLQEIIDDQTRNAIFRSKQ